MTPEEHNRFRKKMFFVFGLMFLLFIGGSFFYYKIEKWRFIDAMYFSAVTMTTVGYGDFHPKTDIGKLFSIFYLFSAVGIALYGLTLFTTHFIELREEKWMSDFKETLNKTRNVKKVLEEFFFDNKKNK